jgi:hypothetical protein
LESDSVLRAFEAQNRTAWIILGEDAMAWYAPMCLMCDQY